VKKCYERWCKLKSDENYQNLEIDPLTLTLKFDEKGENIAMCIPGGNE